MKLAEIGLEYEKSAELLRKRLSDLRKELADETDPEKRFKIKRRIASLTPMLTECNILSEYCTRYYERGFYIGNGPFGIGYAKRFTADDKKKVSGFRVHIAKQGINRKTRNSNQKVSVGGEVIHRSGVRTRSKQKHYISELLRGS